MPPKPDNKLTGDERKLLIISAKLFAALREYALHPPVTEEQHTYWLEKIHQEMVHVLELGMNPQVPTGKHPRLHPAGQLFGQEWTQSQRNKRPFNWSGLTIDAVIDGCVKTRAVPLNAQWHPHLTAVDISEYLREIAQKNWWWTHPPPTPAAPSEDVTMEDPPLQDVPLPPLPPSRSCSRRLAAKGKAPAKALAAPAALPQQSGSTSKGKKRRVATPESESNGDDLFSAEVEDAAADGDDDTPCKAGQLSGVPHMEVEHPSPPSPSSPPRKIRKVIHIGMLDVHVRCGPCIAQKVPQCTSQTKDLSTVACEFCAGKKRKCFPVADWAKPIPDYALYPIQERLDLMEWHFSKVVGLLIVMARGQQIDPDTIAEVTAPPPLPRSVSPSGQSGLSPSVGHQLVRARNQINQVGRPLKVQVRRALDQGVGVPVAEHSPHQSGRPSPLMLSDPLDSPSSDARSFDEDDMYGSDSDVETISLRPFRAQPAINAGDSLMDRLNINMEKGTAMLSALCEAAGLDVSSILSNVPAHASGASSPQIQAAAPSPSGESHTHGE
ncbi:hypothetical protein V8E53_006135 [Lactarius tabidus]